MDRESQVEANFEAIDMDNDGFISFADYHEFLEMNGVDQDCSTVDKNKDGKISFEEFSQFYKKDSDKQKEKLKLKK
ncbi:calcineurin subunit B type 2-like [Lethenteron reissneri]|uniref:calcineurin subunit B type 2-like n=1 Tax=Lethenteron reissneri TaxID=7753 RepID=UPI002AB77EA8|nr:calcineurin subunit B type 2-like [Lethenteron reissneri]